MVGSSRADLQCAYDPGAATARLYNRAGGSTACPCRARRGFARGDVGRLRRHGEAEAHPEPDRRPHGRQDLLAGVRLRDRHRVDHVPATEARPRDGRRDRLEGRRRPRARASTPASARRGLVRLGRTRRRRQRRRRGRVPAACPSRAGPPHDRDAEPDPGRRHGSQGRQLHGATARDLARRRRPLRLRQDPLPAERAGRRRAVRRRDARDPQARHEASRHDELDGHRRR